MPPAQPLPAEAPAASARAVAAPPPAPRKPAPPLAAVFAALVCVAAILNGYRLSADTRLWYDAPAWPPEGSVWAPPPSDAALDPHFAFFLSSAVFDQLAVIQHFNGTDPRGDNDWRGWVRAGFSARGSLRAATRAYDASLAPLYAAECAAAGLIPASFPSPLPALTGGPRDVSFAFAGARLVAQHRVAASLLHSPAAVEAHAAAVGAAVARGARGAPSAPGSGGATHAWNRGRPAAVRADVATLLTQLRRVGLFRSARVEWPAAFDAAWLKSGETAPLHAKLITLEPIGQAAAQRMFEDTGIGATHCSHIMCRRHSESPPKCVPTTSAPQVALHALQAMLMARHGVRLEAQGFDASGADGVVEEFTIARGATPAAPKPALDDEL